MLDEDGDKLELLAPDDPVALFANRMAVDAFRLSATLGISRWELCVGMANACGLILADAAKPEEEPLAGVTMPKSGRPMTRNQALERMDALREIMAMAYELHEVTGRG